MSVDARNRLQPSLFDRLTDDHRSKRRGPAASALGGLAMRSADAEARGITGISDLVDRARSAGLALGLSPDFLGTSGGWPALRSYYGLPPFKIRTIDRRGAVAELLAGRSDLVDLGDEDDEDDPAVLRLADDRNFFLIHEIESDVARVMSKGQFRAAVLRDLGSLFNAVQPLTAAEVATYPTLADSVLNYGIPPLTGQLASKLDVDGVVAAIRRAIVRFEPRVMPDTLDVRAIESESVLDTHNVIEFEIRGHLWSQPLPLEILLRTKLDLEAGQVEVQEAGPTTYRAG